MCIYTLIFHSSSHPTAHELRLEAAVDKTISPPGPFSSCSGAFSRILLQYTLLKLGFKVCSHIFLLASMQPENQDTNRFKVSFHF